MLHSLSVFINYTSIYSVVVYNSIQDVELLLLSSLFIVCCSIVVFDRVRSSNDKIIEGAEEGTASREMEWFRVE